MIQKWKTILQTRKRRTLAVVLTFCMLLSLMPRMEFTAYAAAPDLTISTVEELEAFRDRVNRGETFEGKTVALTRNLDLGEINDWESIGRNNNESVTRYFKGTFDGEHHTIYNLRIKTTIRYSGLFGRLQNAVIKNLGLEDVNVVSSYKDVGGLAGNAQGGSIEGCYVIGSVTGSNGVGGILGSTHSSAYPTTISNCYARVSMAHTGSTKDVAGISGWNEATSVKIINCYSACIGEVRPIAGWSDSSAVQSGQFVNTYFDADLSPNFSNEVGRADLGKSSEELMKQSTFEGYDFDNTWVIASNKNGGYPYLQGFVPGLGGAPSSASVLVEDQYGNPVTDATVVLDNGSTKITLDSEKTGAYSVMLKADDTSTYDIYVNGTKTGKTIKRNGSNAVSVTVTINVGHTHTLVYTAAGAVITETCMNCTHKATATVEHYDGVYTGSPVTPLKISYSGDEWLGGDLEITYSNNINVGTAYGTITIGGVTAEVNFQITPATQDAPSGIGSTDETIDGKKDGTITGVTSAMEYRLDSETQWTAVTGNTVEGLAAGTYEVRYAAKENYNESLSTTVTVNAGRKLKVTFKAEGNEDIVEEVSWQGSITQMPAIPHRDGYDQTLPIWDKTFTELKKIENDITVNAVYTINTYEVTLIGGTGYALTAVDSTSPVEHGGSYTFKLTVADGYSKTGNFKVSVNNAAVEIAADGTYTISNITCATEVKADGIADITAPSAVKAAYEDNKFFEILNTVTFGLFFKDTVTVTLTATDAGSGVKEFTYQLGSGTVQTIEANNGKAVITVEPGFKGNIRSVTAIDKDGNQSEAMAYEYFAVDNAVPTTPTVKTDYTGGTWTSRSVTFTVSGSTAVSGIEKYQYSTDGGKTWKDMTAKEQTADSEAGPASVTSAVFTVSGDTDGVSYIFRAVSRVEKASSPTAATVVKIDTKKPVVSLDSKGYTGGTWSQDNVTLSVSNSVNNGGNTTFEYKADGGSWQTYSIPIIISADTKGTTYTFRATSEAGIVSEEASITVKKDGTNPNGDISIKENSVKQLLNAITFGLFFKEDVDVVITAEDATSEIESIWYYRSERILTEDEVNALTGWSDYTGTISETAEDAEKFVYYVRLTDKAGNSTCFGSDGVIFDTTAPIVSGITDGATYYTTQDVALEDVNLDTVTLNGAEVTCPITLEGNREAICTIAAVDKAGNETTAVITMKPISTISDPMDGVTVDNVKSTDRDTIEAVKEAAEAVDTENATQEEKDALQEIIDRCEELLDRLEEIQNVLEENKDKTEAIDADKTTSDDRDFIEELLDDIEQMIESDNLTDAEREEQQQLKDQLEDILKELDIVSERINEAGKDADGINKDNVKPEDKGKLENAQKELEDVLKECGNHMTNAEKDAVWSRIDNIKNLINQLPTPTTGDLSNLWLWVVLVIISLCAIAAAIYDRKRSFDK